MYQVHCLNQISSKGMDLLTQDYTQTPAAEEAQAILVRSAAMHDMAFSHELLAIARAGAGVNNIPLEKAAEQGVVVFNTPGANANSVVELCLCGMLLGSRDVVDGINWVQSIKDQDDIAKKVEKGKSKFAGHELAGKSLGVIGLGAVGGPVANAARRLGMTVYGCDPFISIDAAWHLDSHIIKVNSRDEIYQKCDMITLHTSLLPDTTKMINRESLGKMKDGVVFLNFARDLLVDDEAMEEALRSGKVRRYITDFPNQKTASMAGVIAIPHLGASTQESEDKCAMMAVRQVMDYLENGNIVNSVNYPNCDMGICTKPGRLVILHRNIPNSLGQFTSAVAKRNINISDLMNRSRGAFACTILDLDTATPQELVEDLKTVDGVLRVRKIR